MSLNSYTETLEENVIFVKPDVGSSSFIIPTMDTITLGSHSTTVTLHNTQLSSDNQLLRIIEDLDREMDVYEDPSLLDEALKCILLQELHQKADAIQSSPKPLPSFEDALAETLVHWFRDDFFIWMDRKTDKCPICQSNPLNFDTIVIPTDEEKRGDAHDVELYKCADSDCSGTFRFPRYSHPSMLMRTQVGRCGEFACLFRLFLRAVGLRAQYVWNQEDRYWNAYYSPTQERWIHIDPCEAERDQPLLYSRDWGKRMTYCLAFSCDGAMDVSKGYILSEKWPEAMSLRNLVSESELAHTLEAITRRRRMGRASEIVQVLEQEDLKMKQWLNASDTVRGGSIRRPGF